MELVTLKFYFLEKSRVTNLKTMLEFFSDQLTNSKNLRK